MRNRIIVIILAALVLSSCGKVLTSKKTKVSFWHGLSGPLGDTLNEMIMEFNRSQDEIEVVANPISSYSALSQKLMASIQAKKQPDIAQVFESWTSKYIESDVIVSISDLIAEDEDFTDEDLVDIYPVFRDSNTFEGVIYSFPFNKSVRAYFYNKDDFYRNGLDPDYFPKTWDEFRKYANLLTYKDEKRSKGQHYGTNFNVNEWQFVNLLHQAGGEVLDSQGKPAINSPEGVEALSYITDMMYKDKSVYLVQEYDGQNDFMAGIASMYEGSSVSITHMRQQPINFNIGYAPLPTHRTKQSAVSGANIVIFKSGDRKREKAAWEFVKWFTDTDQTARFSVATSYMPVRKSAMSSQIIQDFLVDNPQFKGIYDQLEDAVFEPQTGAWFKARVELKNYLEYAMRNEMSPKEALDGAAKKFAELISAEKR